jgi:hypothetical protein
VKAAVAALLAAVHLVCAHADDCPAPDEVAQAQLLGTWQARIEGVASPLTLTLVKHPEFAGTVRGQLERGGQRIELAGDVDNGDFTLEESANGRNITATWLGEVVEGSCGREIRGTWKSEGAGEARTFVLKKEPGH